MKLLPLICVALLAACAEDPGPQGQCEREAYNDPAVKEMIAQGTSGGGELQADLLNQRKYAIRDATNRCLASKGVIRPGGVERMKQN